MGALDGKAVVITGGAGLLGAEYARLMAAQGASVLVNDTNAQAAEALVAEIARAGGAASAFVESVDSWERAGRVIQACLDRYGRIDCLVNSAHRTTGKPIWQMTEADFDLTMDIHVKGHFACVSHAAAAMVRQKTGGSIVTVGSRALSGHPGLSPYAAAKGAILSATLSWALELADHRVRVNCILPAAVRPGGGPPVRHIPWHWDFTFERITWYFPVPGPATVAPLVLYLASDASNWVTGQVIFLSGDTLALFHHPREARLAFRPDGWTCDDIAREFKEALGATLEMPGTGVNRYRWYDGVK